MNWKVILVLAVSSCLYAQMPVPTPPSVYIDTTYNLPVGGTTRNAGCTHVPVTDFNNFQSAINAAVPGDVVQFTHSCTYQGNLSLPAKTNTLHKWIYIIPDDYASIPAPGVRIAPSNSALLGQFVSVNTSPTVSPAAGANYYRLVGMELYSASVNGCQPTNNPVQNCFQYFLFGNSTGGTIGNLPDHIYIDRCYIHGSPTQDILEGVQGNVSYLAVIDSYISDIHFQRNDSQAIEAYLTPGPIKVTNNFLSATTEDMMFGGAGGHSNPYIPSDIEIRYNHFYKPLTWFSCSTGGTVTQCEKLANGYVCPGWDTQHNVSCNGGTVNSPINQWATKDNLEFKSARRVVVTNNILENNWVSAQVGYSLNFTIRTSQSGDVAVVNDIDFENNVITNVTAGINTLEQDNQCGPPSYPSCTNPGQSLRVRVANNLFLLAPTLDTFQHTWLKVDAGNLTHPGLTDYVFQHNTAKMSDGSNMWNYVFSLQSGRSWNCTPPTGYSSTHNLWMIDNAIERQPTGDCSFTGTTGLNWYMPDPLPLAPRYVGNVMFKNGDTTTYTWPTNNDVPTVWSFDSNNVLVTPDWHTHTSDGIQAGWVGTTPTLQINTTVLPNGQVGLAYSQTLSASGGVPPYTWSIVTGTLPHLLSLNASTGVISGTPDTIGTSNFTVKVCDTVPNCTAPVPLSITIITSGGGIAITTTSLPNGVLGGIYVQTLAATGGTPPYTWSESGSLPTGLTLNTSTGVIGSAPTASGTFPFTVSVCDTIPNCAGPQALSIHISGGNLPLSIATITLPPGVVGIPYSSTLQALGGTPPYTWSETGSLPHLLSLNTSTGNISGTPDTPGTSNFTVSVTDAVSNHAGPTPLSITISPSPCH